MEFKWKSSGEQQTLLETNYLRPSSIEQFARCPYQWYLVHILGKKRPPAAAARAGNALHIGAEKAYEDKIKTGAVPPKSYVLDVAAEAWEKINEEEELVYQRGETADVYKDQIVVGMGVYYDNAIETVTPTAVEKRYSVSINHPIFTHISGTLDIVLEKGIADIKFTKRKTTATHYIIQQSIYAWLRNENNEPTSILELHNVIRGTDKFYLIGMQPKIKYALFWLDKLLHTTEQFHKTGDESLFLGSTPTSNYLCNKNWCGFWDECPWVKYYREEELPSEPLLKVKI